MRAEREPSLWVLIGSANTWRTRVPSYWARTGFWLVLPTLGERACHLTGPVLSFDWFCQNWPRCVSSYWARTEFWLVLPRLGERACHLTEPFWVLIGNLRVLNFDWTTSKFYPMDKVISTLRTTWPWILEHIRLAQHLNFSFDLSGEQDSASS